MYRTLTAAIAVAIVLCSILASPSAARLSANHNLTRLGR